MQKVLFAFSGGIDDVLSVHWLRQNRGYNVVALLADMGQSEYLEPLGELALESGAEGTIIVDLRRRFLEDYVFPTLISGAQYEDYLLATPLARYAICEEVVRLACDQSIEWIGHGSSLSGNDQVRFEASVAAMAPSLKVLAPLREWRFSSLEEKLQYLHRLRLPERPEFLTDSSRDSNLWGCGQVYGDLIDPWNAPPEHLYVLTRNPIEAPSSPEELTIGFRQGIPVSLNEKELDPVSLVQQLNLRGGEHGIGRLDHIENRLLGGKSREIYEAPGATLLYLAHGALEELTQARDLGRCKRMLAEEYGRLVYEGFWFSELREALDGFFESSQRYVTGRVRLELFKGNASVKGRESRHSLYDAQLTDTPEGTRRLREVAPGFVDILTQPRKSEALHRHRR
ncbi:MAG: argininosuccinate synthase [Planctomycetota bacterium]